MAENSKKQLLNFYYNEGVKAEEEFNVVEAMNFYKKGLICAILEDSNDEEECIVSVQPETITRNIGKIYGCGDAKAVLNEAIVWPIKYKNVFEGQRSWVKGVLLFGTPGNGKTTLVMEASKEGEAKFMNIRGSDLLSKWVSEGEKMVKKIFATARKNIPTIIFIDEIDLVLSFKSDGEAQSSKGVLSELLTELDGAGNVNEGVILVATSNRPQNLPENFLRRLELKIFVLPPKREHRKEYLMDFLHSCNRLLTDKDITYFVDNTSSFSFFDMERFCRAISVQHARLVVKGLSFKKCRWPDAAIVVSKTLYYWKATYKEDPEGEILDLSTVEVATTLITAETLRTALADIRQTVLPVEMHRQHCFAKQHAAIYSH